MTEAARPSGASPEQRREPFSAATGAALVLILCGIIFFAGLWKVPFYEKGEPREGLVAWEIWQNGNWILPLRTGTKIPSKPPLFHWIAAAASLSAGTFNEFTVRFPSALLATLGVLLTYSAGARLWGVTAGLTAAIVLATSPEWWRAATTARVDMTLTFFMLCTFLYFYFLYKTGGGLAKSLLLAFFAGMATLAKGPVGAALPGLAALAFLWRKRDLAFIKRLHLPMAIPFGIVVAGSWYLAAYAQGGEKFFLRQIVHEIVGTPLGGAGHNHNPLYYIPALIAGMAPWSLFFPALAIFLFQRRRRLAEEELLYPLVWFATGFIVLSIAVGKRSVYILPLYPAVALLFGAWWKTLADDGISSAWARAAAAVAGSVFLVVGATLGARIFGWDLLELFGTFLRGKNREGLALIAQAMDRRVGVIAICSALTLFVAALVIRDAWKNSWNKVFSGFAILMTFFLGMTQSTFHPAFAAKYSFKPFMRRAQQIVRPDTPLVFYNRANKAAAFYARAYFPSFRRQAAGIEPPFFLMIWEDDWTSMAAKEGMKELDVSETTGWDGRQRLYLVRVDKGAVIEIRETDESGDDDETEP